MSAGLILDTIERLFRNVGHPDITDVYRYTFNGEQAVGMVYQDRARAFIWPVPGRVEVTPADLPDDLGAYDPRVNHVLKMLVDLLDLTKPDGWRWRLVGVEGVAVAPCGLEVRAGNSRALLRVTAGGALDEVKSDPASWAGWTYPDAARLNG